MAALAQSKKLEREQATKKDRDDDLAIPTYKRVKIRQIAPITMFNDWVAIIPFVIDSSFELPAAAEYRNVGIVVGISATVLAYNGERVPSCLAIGDVVLFQKRSVVAEMAINKDPYVGDRIVLVSERNVICKLPKVPFEIVEYQIDAIDFAIKGD